MSETPNLQNLTKKEHAALLLAEDELSDEKIAELIGRSRQTLANWKKLPEFQELVATYAERIQTSMYRHFVAKKHKRIGVLDDLYQKSLRVIEERASAHRDDAPGGDTGLLVKQYKMVGGGENAQLVEEWVVDTGLMREIRAIASDAAKELGQIVDKSDIKLGGSLRREYVIVTGDGD